MSNYINPKIHWVNQEHLSAIFLVVAEISTTVNEAITKHYEVEETPTYQSVQEVAVEALLSSGATISREIQDDNSRFSTTCNSFIWEILNRYTKHPFISNYFFISQDDAEVVSFKTIWIDSGVDQVALEGEICRRGIIKLCTAKGLLFRRKHLVNYFTIYGEKLGFVEKLLYLTKKLVSRFIVELIQIFR